METNNKVIFWKLITGVSLFGLILVLAFQISYAWTNPATNPPTSTGAISVSGGNVGIGTTAPGAKLQIGSIVNTVPAGTDLAITNYLRLQGGGNADYGGYIRNSISGTRDLIIGTRNFSTDLDTITVQGTTGRVGIGTTAPGVRLQVNQQEADQPALGTAGGNFALINASDGFYGLYMGIAPSGNTWIQAQRNNSATAYNILLQSNGGAVGINQASPDAANYKLTIGSQTSANSGIKVETTSATNPAGYFANAGGGVAIKVDSGKGSIIAGGGLVIENRTTDPTTPAVGQMWLRTDL